MFCLLKKNKGFMMKSNKSLVLFAVYFFGLIISGTGETDDIVPLSVSTLYRSLQECDFDKFLTGEQLADKEFLDSNYKEFVEMAQRAKQLLLDNKTDEGRNYLIRSIRDKTIDNPEINTQLVVREFFGGDPKIVSVLIKNLVKLFIEDVYFESSK